MINETIGKSELLDLRNWMMKGFDVQQQKIPIVNSKKEDMGYINIETEYINPNDDKYKPAKRIPKTIPEYHKEYIKKQKKKPVKPVDEIRLKIIDAKFSVDIEGMLGGKQDPRVIFKFLGQKYNTKTIDEGG